LRQFSLFSASQTPLPQAFGLQVVTVTQSAGQVPQFSLIRQQPSPQPVWQSAGHVMQVSPALASQVPSPHVEMQVGPQSGEHVPHSDGSHTRSPHVGLPPVPEPAEPEPPPVLAPPVLAPPVLAPPVLAPPVLAPPVLAPPVLLPAELPLPPLPLPPPESLLPQPTAKAALPTRAPSMTHPVRVIELPISSLARRVRRRVRPLRRAAALR
jgi:hypothetical protein